MRIMSIVIAVLVSIGLYFFIFDRDQLTGNQVSETESDETPAPPGLSDTKEAKPVSVVAIHSVARELDSAVILRGETEAARQVKVTAQTGGQVVSDPLRKGAYVKQDQLLCELDPGIRASTLAQARAALAEAEVGLKNAQKLSEGGFAAETRVLSAEAALENARASVAQAQIDIDRLKITAPFAGLLETDTAEYGTLLQAGSECATVIQLDPIKLVGFAPEAEVNKIEVGALAGARLISGQTVSGRVTFLSRSSDPATRTFRVEMEVPNTDFTIRDGQTVEIGISSAGRLAHLVAQSALTLNNDGVIGLRTVNADNIVEFNPIEVIRDTQDGIWVAGLPQQADIITVGHEYVREGVIVDPHFEEQTQ
ncbi:multidrug efflux system membrane fusion protein [Pacificibacter maritimus]|uniref:Multidrug efflux system membrane fusion protein n=1 Tax=Pacificibacter maritimus TaxID=762213 RepID=A0A3N4USI5_9RHOB|nr:efflux RND transporter periplasmic adaptor subunit [Pacificibacter maritimus]RPE71655.1 multidrug efflux system membrane fusion protein [Pacificibacter maritimus]